MGAARVSVVVTCFNLGAYLPEALESIYAQTFRDLEIRVVDDGSTDEATERVLREAAGKVAVVRTDNRGLSAARNARRAAHVRRVHLRCRMPTTSCLPTLVRDASVGAAGCGPVGRFRLALARGVRRRTLDVEA